MRPGKTAGGVKQAAVHRISEPCAHRAELVDLRSCGERIRARRAVILDAAERAVGLDAEHPVRRILPIITGLETAEPAVRVEIGRHSEDIVVFMELAPAVAGMRAYIGTIPCPRRRP